MDDLITLIIQKFGLLQQQQQQTHQKQKMQIPQQLRYNKLFPKGFYSTFKQWQVEPLNGMNSSWPGQLIRIPFLGISNTGVFDPYRSHLQLAVTCNITSLPVGQLRVDNSAQSFIQQLVINSGSRQIQRIPQYSILAAYLNDIGLSDIFAQGKQTQGLGYSNLQSIDSINWKPNNSMTGGQTYQPGAIQGTTQVWNWSFPTVFPTQMCCFPQFNTYGLLPIDTADKMVKGHALLTNTGWVQTPDKASSGTQSTAQSLTQWGYARNLRAQYISSIQSSKFPESTSCQTPLNLTLPSTVYNNTWPALFGGGKAGQTTQYLVNVNNPNFTMSNFYNNGTTDVSINPIPNTTSVCGFSNLASPAFMKGTNQPFISPTVPQLQMSGGIILPYKVPILTRTFKIPLMSAVMGILIPQGQFALLPVAALNNLQLQVTLDPYAMFTSGYNDISQYDTIGIGIQQQRAFQVKGILYNLHMYQFGPSVQQYIQSSLVKQIVFNSHYWTLANNYQIPTGQQVTGSYGISCQSQSLSEVLSLFVPSDYLTWSFCRKHFRISNCVTKIQYRINMQYYPPQPIVGNAGNPVAVDIYGDNSSFLDLLYWSQNYHFQSGVPMPRINAYNFAINQRCYDPTNTATLYDSSMKNSFSYAWSKSSVNYDTAMGISDLHQNRYVGKAGYPFSFQPYAHSSQHLIGLDCRQIKQFDVIFVTDNANFFPRQQMLYIFTKSNAIVSYSPNGIFLTGK